MPAAMPKEWFRGITTDRYQELAEMQILTALAGECAQEKRLGSGAMSEGDQRLVRGIMLLVSEPDEEAHIGRLKTQARAMLDVPVVWRTTTAIAEALLEKRQLDAEELESIYRHAIKG